MHAFDRRTDRILIARPRLHSMQRGKKLDIIKLKPSLGALYAHPTCTLQPNPWHIHDMSNKNRIQPIDKPSQCPTLVTGKLLQTEKPKTYTARMRRISR